MVAADARNRSLLAHPGYQRNLERLNAVKDREHFRRVAPRLADADDPFDGPLPSPYMPVPGRPCLTSVISDQVFAAAEEVTTGVAACGC